MQTCIALDKPEARDNPWTPDGAMKPRTPVQGSPAPPLRRLLRSMATLEPVRVAYCTVCGLPPEFCEYNTEVPHPASTQDAPARPSGGSGAGKAEQALAALSLEGTGGASAGGSAGAELVRDGLRARLCPFADSLRARVPRPRAAQILRAQTRPRKAPKVAKSQPRSRRVVTPAQWLDVPRCLSHAGPTSTLFGCTRSQLTRSTLQVVIERATRNKRKCVTTVIGLDQFGVKLADASKKFGKKFACGASVTKDASNKEQIDVQARAACVCSCAFAASLALLQAGRLHG